MELSLNELSCGAVNEPILTSILTSIQNILPTIAFEQIYVRKLGLSGSNVQTNGSPVFEAIEEFATVFANNPGHFLKTRVVVYKCLKV